MRQQQQQQRAPPSQHQGPPQGAPKQQPQMRQPTPKQQPKPAQKPSTQSPRYPLSAVGTTGTPGVTTREAVILTRKSKQAIKEEIEMYVVLTIIVISRGSVELCSDNYFFLKVLSSTLSGSLNRISNVDITTPFQNVMDACKRLLPFHIFHEVTDEELDWDAKVQFQKRVDAVSLQPLQSFAGVESETFHRYFQGEIITEVLTPSRADVYE